MIARFLLLFACLVLLHGPVQAQKRHFSLDDLYHPQKRFNFNGSPPTDLEWLQDGEHYFQRRTGRNGIPVLRITHARTGQQRDLYDPERLEAALAALPGFSTESARNLLRRARVRLTPTEEAVLIVAENDLFLYDLESPRVHRLTHSHEPPQEIEFSPDGRMAAFIRDHDLYVVDLPSGPERRLTTGGSEALRNGLLDWVYQEEIYGRGNFKGYWWSPDSASLAYLQLDISEVPRFPLVDDIPIHPDLQLMRYPKAGDPNPRVRLGVVPAGGGSTRWMDLSNYEGSEFLIVRVGWTPDGRKVVFQVQDREQTWLDLNLVDARGGKTATLFRETTPAWVDVLEEPNWLEDGSFLWLSERSGWRHLYHYPAENGPPRAVTSGEWQVLSVHGVDEAGGRVYFSGTERSPTALDVYRVRLDGSGLTRLSQREGWHEARFSPDLALYIGQWHDFHTPIQVRLHDSEGHEVRVIDENRVEVLEEYELGEVEFLQVETRDGFPMEALLIKPPDFDASRKYPVLVFTYGGPQAQQVRNRWGGVTHLWHHMLAQKGYLIWICDNRTASGKGAQSAWPLYRNFGPLELRDLEDGVAWLKSRPWVDGARIGIWGWSFGGYVTAYALTHSRTFKMGIAGAPVTDWRLYDTIYTERYMGMPQNNPEGYERSSVVKAASRLHGRLLLIHGTMDDNVHLQNTLQLAHELQKAGKDFELMLYPKSRHGVRDPPQLHHLRRLMTRFILDNL